MCIRDSSKEAKNHLLLFLTETEKPHQSVSYTHIDVYKRQGLGIAPIGHVVTVQGVTETAVNITTNITYQEDWNWSAIEGYGKAAIDQYFTDLSAQWAEEEHWIEVCIRDRFCSNKHCGGEQQYRG